jgi:GT2 family glycosyltransferase
VAIVFHHGIDDLRRCLGCLSRQTVPPARIIVVDNSTDGLAASACGAEAPAAEILRPTANLGFAGGNNLALAQTRTEFFATLNADAFPGPGWLGAMFDAARSHPGAAAFGSLQLLDSDPSLADGTGDLLHFSGLAWRRGHLRPLAEIQTVPGEIFSPCGAAAFFRTADLQSIGGFDADFFCYCEDIDAGFRLWLAGRSCRFVPDAVVRHRGAGSTGDSRSDFAVYHGHRNLVWVYLKNMPGIFLWAFLPFQALLNIHSLLALSVRGQGAAATKAKLDALLGIARVWEKRLAVQARRKASLREIWRILDKGIPPEPWRRTLGKSRGRTTGSRRRLSP